MLWVFIGLLGGFAFVFLTRLFWSTSAANQGARSPMVTLAIITMIATLVIMIATGRLHWLSATVTAAIPFLRRAVSLLRFAPVLQSLFGRTAKARPEPPQSATAGVTVAQARQMLEVSDTADRAEIIAAHRRLMTRNHPDKGGSNYIAAQLNSAKELLLDELDRA